ncbi:mitochondrial genome maintenance exonuclease 1-like [Uloborus diversus]|uniref:mitochondrial genome maintenance exonuclease 1-like n=1 Tax=Uloborus diversus TaxID=327109 RepID=UPI002409D0F1|nr:mitochondrial genome maintenance exonuclease 1-like [Uloborus diversus]
MVCWKCMAHHLKAKNYAVVCERLIAYSASNLKKDAEQVEDKIETFPKKKKLTILKRTFPTEGKNPIATEMKLASSVVKRLNWENKHLFGPVQIVKESEDKRRIASNEIIQHETQIPIVEPNMKPDHINHNYLKYIKDFPLLNQSGDSNDDLCNKIKNANILRNYLKDLSTRTTTPSVSSILEKTMPSERALILKQWKEKMINTLGEEGFQKYQSELLQNGSSLHNTINNYLTVGSEADLVIRDENFGHWKSLKGVLPLIKEVKLLEEHIFHPFLCYRGVIDCFATYKNHLVVIDWKTSKKPKMDVKSLYDMPLQIAAYVGALNFDPRFQYLVSKGLIVVAYDTGIHATVHFISEKAMKEYWNQWLNRVTLYWESVTKS